MRTVAIELERELELERDPGGPGPAHLAAASGVVEMGDYLYVIADDEVSLGVFPRAGGPGRLATALPGALPRDPAQRKQDKPDLEALTHLPSHAGAPHGALLALGSGSSSRRRRGAWLALGADGALAGEPQVVELAGLYEALGRRVPDLNVEGATVSGDELVLAQRGEGPEGVSALVYLDLAQVLAAAAAGGRLEAEAVREVRPYALGEVDGVKLAFSDVSALPDGRIVFSAVAEDAPDAHTDGPFVGAVVGVIDPEGEVAEVRRLSPGAKVEGIRATAAAGGIDLLLVADPDERAVPAPVFSARL